MDKIIAWANKKNIAPIKIGHGFNRPIDALKKLKISTTLNYLANKGFLSIPE